MKKKKNTIKTIISHLVLFVIIEILFVFVVLQEFPSFSLLEAIGIVHGMYWILLIVAGLLRESLKKYWQKFLATYLPLVFHVAGHIYIGIVTVEYVHEHDGHSHDIFRMIIATIALGVLIYVGEWLLHRKEHCDVCHTSVHKHCKSEY